MTYLARSKQSSCDLDNLIQGYRLCLRTEGKSPNTVAIYTAALTFLMDYLRANDHATDVTEIGVHEIRHFILYLQQVKAWKVLTWRLACSGFAAKVAGSARCPSGPGCSGPSGSTLPGTARTRIRLGPTGSS